MTRSHWTACNALHRPFHPPAGTGGVISSLLLLLDLSSANSLSIREFPELERSVITVITQYPGASARTVEGFVTTPLQSSIAGARGGRVPMTATSDPSSSEISVHVSWVKTATIAVE